MYKETMTKEQFISFVKSECLRQWADNQEELLGPWEFQSDDVKAEYYNDMYKLKLLEVNIKEG